MQEVEGYPICVGGDGAYPWQAHPELRHEEVLLGNCSDFAVGAYLLNHPYIRCGNVAYNGRGELRPGQRPMFVPKGYIADYVATLGHNQTVRSLLGFLVSPTILQAIDRPADMADLAKED